MHPRKIHDRLTDLLSRYPAVMLLGPRGVGKTTLARQFSDLYYDIEHPEDLIRLDIEWGPRMRGRELMVLDEIHTVPELFLRLLPMIDEQRSRNGRFLMTESMASPLLKSLEGRCVLCELPPFLIGEMPEDRWDDLWMTGGYPVPEEVSPSFPDRQRICLKGMSQRDLPNWGFPAPPRVTEQLFRMLAAAHGQIWNASEIGRSLGISYHTADTYTAFLERACLIRRLPASTITLGKRLIKSPKLYWRDTGLLHTLLGLTHPADLYMQPWVGASWEGWVIEQIIGHLKVYGYPVLASHFRTNDRYTLDLLLEHQGKRWAIDITISSAPEEPLMDRLATASRLVGADHAILVSRTAEPRKYHGVTSLSLVDTLQMLGVWS